MADVCGRDGKTWVARATGAGGIGFPRDCDTRGFARAKARGSGMALIAVILVWQWLSGCWGGQGLLIRPVSTNRPLVETVLSRDGVFAFDKIAVIDVSGVMANSAGSGLFGDGEHPVSLLVEQLDKARRDRRVKGVVLRINSPGGTVTASELMHAEIERFKESGKPIVAVMMDVAASGGYYIACACDEIIAHKSTVTGSIGVIMQMFDISETLRKLGVTTDAITSGPHKDTGSPFRPMRSEERELFQGIIDEMYRQFVAVVAEGRPDLDEEKVRELADGRVFLAPEALSLGLIDRIGTLREAIASIKERIGGQRVRVVMYHRAYGYKPNYYATHSGVGNVNLINVDLSRLTDRATPRFLYVWRPG